MKHSSLSIRPFVLLAISTAFLLLIPLVAMQFTHEVNWTPGDFFFAGILLFSAGSIYIFLKEKAGNTQYKIAAGISVAASLFLVWSNLAVGIIGSENNEFNLLYFGVIMAGLIGLSASRFEPRKLSFTLLAMALTQTIITVAALITGMQHVPGSSVPEVLAVNGFFITLYLMAAILFRNSSLNSVTNSADNLQSS
jgi:hypothetical protein